MSETVRAHTQGRSSIGGSALLRPRGILRRAACLALAVLVAALLQVALAALAPGALSGAPANLPSASANLAYADTAQGTTPAAFSQNSLTVSGLEQDDKVAIYQVVSTTCSTDNAMQSDFTDAVKAALAKNGSTLTFNDYKSATQDADIAANAQTIAAAVTAQSVQATDIQPGDTAGTATFTNLAAGQYLIVVQNSTATVGTRVYQPIIQSVEPTASTGGDGTWQASAATFDITTAKYTTVEIAKQTSADGITWSTQTNRVGMGRRAYFRLMTVIPTNYALDTNDTRTMYLVDGLAKGLTFDGADTLSVTVGGTTLTEGTDYTVLDATSFVQQFDGESLDTGAAIKLSSSVLRAYAGQAVTVTYRATVNSDARALTCDTNMAPARLVFAPNTYTPLTAGDLSDFQVSEPAVAYVVVYRITVNKQDAQGNALAGAQFQILNAEGTAVTTFDGTSVMDADGTVVDTPQDKSTFTSQPLPAGTYTVHETKAPDGYALAEDQQVTLEGAEDHHGSISTVTIKDVKLSAVIGSDAADTTGSPLNSGVPTLGDAQTAACVVLGVLAMAAALVGLARNRRKKRG